MKLYFFFSLFYPILLYDIIYDIIHKTNGDVMFTLNDYDVEQLYFWPYLERIIKGHIKLFG